MLCCRVCIMGWPETPSPTFSPSFDVSDALELSAVGVVL